MDADTAIESDECSAEEAFEHLSELYTALPRMQEIGARLAQAKCALLAVETHARLRSLRREIETLEAQEAAAAAAAELAQSEGRSPEAVKLLNCDRLYYAAMRGFKVGPAKNEQVALEDALKAGGFTSPEEAEAAVLPGDEFERLSKELVSYQADYAETLALCQRLEAANI
ncbi:MAG TPA: hypothetical protein DEB24_00675 [Coriobacteriia bacterium]|nr:hypothetical protein [Coriobacteriia bacterium]